MATLKFNKDRAFQADAGGKGITTSGVYFGKLTRASFGKSPNGAKTFECAFEEEGTGRTTDYITIYLTNNEGEEIFGMDKLHALLGILRIEAADTKTKVSEDGKTRVETLPCVCGHRIGVILQRNDYTNKKGEEKFRMDLLHFLDAETKKTYSELASGGEARTVLREVKDKKAAGAARKSSAPAGWQDDAERGTDVEDTDLPF